MDVTSGRVLWNTKIITARSKTYRRQGQDIDLHAHAEPEPGIKGATKSLLERLLQWYVARQQKKQALHD